MTGYLPALPVALLLATSLLLLALHRVLPVLVSIWAATVAVALAFLVACALWVPLQNGTIALSLYDWLPGKGMSIALALRVDSFSLLMLLLSLVAAFVVLFHQAALRAARREAQNVAAATFSETTLADATDDANEVAPREERHSGLEVAAMETTSTAWMLALLAAVALLLIAGNGVTTYLAWTLVGLCAFASKLSAAGGAEQYQSARQFVVVDLLAGYCLLAAASLSVSTSGSDFPAPSTLLAPNGALIVALCTVPALVRSLQYPFSRIIVLTEAEPADRVGLFQALVFALSGSYLLLRALAAAPGGGETIRAVLLVLATLTVAYGLVMLMRESALPRLTSWALVVALGLATSCFAIGGFAPTVAGLVIIVTQVLGRVALCVALEGRKVNLALSVASLVGLPPLAGFWGYWTMAGVGLSQGHLLLFLLPVFSLPLVMWRMLRALDIALSKTDHDPGGRWASSLTVLPIAVLALAAIFPTQLVQTLVEPAARAISGSNDHLTSLAVMGGEGYLAGWLAVLALCVLLVAIWLVWRADPLPGARKRLGLAPARTSGIGTLHWHEAVQWALAFDLVATMVSWLSQPELIARSLARSFFSAGRALGLVAEGIEDRYFAPAMVLMVVVVMLMFLG